MSKGAPMEVKNADGSSGGTPITDQAAFFVELEDDEMRRQYGLDLHAELVKAEDARALERGNNTLREALKSIKGCADALFGLQPNLSQMNKIEAISNLAAAALRDEERK